MSRGSDWERLIGEQIQRNGRLFFGLAHGLLRNRETAEDVCQHALLKAWQERETLLDPESLRSWLCTVVVNESLRLCRRNKLERSARESGNLPAGRPEEKSNELIDLRDSVTASLEKLPANLREVVVLRLMEGIKGQDVSRMLGISAVDVSRRLYQAIDHLREHLGDWQTMGNKS